MRLSTAITSLLITARSLSTSRAFDKDDKDEDSKVLPAAVGVDENSFLGGNSRRQQQQQKEDVILLSSSSASSNLPRPTTKGRGRQLLNKGNFMMMGKQRLSTIRPGKWMDADIGVLEYGTHTQYLHHNQGRQVQDTEDEGSYNITTAFDYAYYVFCTYLNCTCTDVDSAEQTMSASCDRPGDICSNAIYTCLAANGKPTNSCVYDLSYAMKITGPDTFHRNSCKIRSSPYYEKVCWYYDAENVSYSEEDGLTYDIKECNMTFNGEMCNSCTPVPTKIDYCYPDGNCINHTISCNDFDCTNTAQGKFLFLFKCIL
jgi:hypothetical protein